MPPGSDASLVEVIASFFWDKIETIHKSFNPEDHLSVPSTFLNGFPSMTSFKPVTLSNVRWLQTKAKPTTYLSDTIPTMLLKTHLEAFLPLITRLIKPIPDFWYLSTDLEESHSDA